MLMLIVERMVSRLSNVGRLRLAQLLLRVETRACPYRDALYHINSLRLALPLLMVELVAYYLRSRIAVDQPRGWLLRGTSAGTLSALCRPGRAVALLCHTSSLRLALLLVLLLSAHPRSCAAVEPLCIGWD